MADGNVILFVFLKIPDQLLCQHMEVLLLYIHTKHRKLISAHPVCIASNTQLQDIRHPFNHSVPIFMAVAVVDFLHSIDINIDNTQ